MNTYDLLKLHNLLSDYAAGLNKRANDVLEVYENRENDRERLATCVILYNGYKEKWLQCCRLLNDIKEDMEEGN